MCIARTPERKWKNVPGDDDDEGAKIAHKLHTTKEKQFLFNVYVCLNAMYVCDDVISTHTHTHNTTQHNSYNITIHKQLTAVKLALKL